MSNRMFNAAILLCVAPWFSACGPSASSSPSDTQVGEDGDAPGASAAGARLVPASGAWLGHFYGNGTIAQTEVRIGRKPAVELNYFGWNEDWTTDTRIADDFRAGKIPLVNWEPAIGDAPVDFDKIIAGDYDDVIRARAAGSKALGHAFFLDFAAEMNGEEGWGGHVPERYIAGYRHIHDLFVSAGATNAVWIWAPNVTDDGGLPAMDYYPGDDYVDWTGVDGYNWGTSDTSFEWQSFHDVFQDIYPVLAARQKPIFIGEMASDEVGGAKADWIGGIVGTLKNQYPLIKGFVWFDIEKERHWPIDSSTASLDAYKRMAADPYLNAAPVTTSP